MEKKKRREPKGKQHEDDAKIYCVRVESNALKLATQKIYQSRNLPHGHGDKNTDIYIVKEIKALNNSSVSVMTVGMIVRDE